MARSELKISCSDTVLKTQATKQNTLPQIASKRIFLQGWETTVEITDLLSFSHIFSLG